MSKTKWSLTAILFLAFLFLAARTLIDLANDVKGTLPVANGGSGVTSAQGNGSKVQLSTGSTTNGHSVIFDANGNTSDGGSAPLTGGGTTSGSSVAEEITRSPDLPPGSANAMDDEFSAANGTVVNTSTKWTWQNQGAATATQNNGALILQPDFNTGGWSTNILYQAAPGSTPWEFETKMSLGTQFFNYSHCGLMVGDGTKLQSFGPFINNDITLAVRDWTTVTGLGTEIETISTKQYVIYLKVKNDGTNIIFSHSLDGISFTSETAATFAKASFLSTVSRVGIMGVIDNANNMGTCSFYWFRRTL